MLRLRRYRAFVVCAVVILFLLYRVSRNTGWDNGQALRLRPATEAGSAGLAGKSRPPERPDISEKGNPATGKQAPFVNSSPPPPRPPPKKEPADETPDKVKIPQLKTTFEIKNSYALPTPTKAGNLPPLEPGEAPSPTQFGDANADGQLDPLHIQQPPGKVQDISLSATSTIHWRKVPEHFPVPEESLILLPTGKPKPIPKIQFDFKSESPEAKARREDRLAQIKVEAVRAWSGYTEYAFGHDELVPIEKTFKDPFCGWAATLVDSLDTLWIMGLKQEFAHAYNALNDIDFTTTPHRSDIPVFETIIRYLGGLIAAYDVTGGHTGDYPLLLKKAVELAEVLMGVFDTPNRMPVLYYDWKPAFVSQPHRASTNAGVAELGSMSMEFTRLAQLTGKDKYYDAIARITDAFEEWQNRKEDGTLISGIFPQRVDASGCNRTATSLNEASTLAQDQAQGAEMSPPQGYSPPQTENGGPLGMPYQPEPNRELQATTGAGNSAPGTGEVNAVGKREITKRSPPHGNIPVPGETLVETAEQFPVQSPAERGRFKAPQPLDASGLPADWDCVPQNLTSGGYGSDEYGMGGSQDSAYEYFPKQFLLLGGLEPKYRTMHEKTVDAVKKYLLFRPMIQDESRDILFCAQAKSRLSGDELTIDYEYEVTHLTCFLGGMFGMGGKIFDSPEDVEIGKRLADGCAWAYEAMPAGVMPEFAHITPCRNSRDCPWNETDWHEAIDPDSEWRMTQMGDYYRKLKEWEEEKQVLLRKEAERLLLEEERAKHQPPGDPTRNETLEDMRESVQGERLGEQASQPGAGQPKPRPEDARSDGGVSPSRLSDDEIDRQKQSSKRDVMDHDLNIIRPIHADKDTGEEEKPAMPDHPEIFDENAIAEKVKKLEAELDLNSITHGHSSSGSFGGMSGQIPIDESQSPVTPTPPPAPEFTLPPKPYKPQTHQEFVLERIETEGLVPGFTNVIDRRYILRPEAIESVWYMYRITGDPTWQEKGWKMWEAIIRHTRTGVAHSAITNVLEAADPTYQDSMESFWLAETLKYFYLLFAEPDVVSLDDWVLNTEAHPFRRPT